MPGTENFMAGLLAIIASTGESEDQQIDAATKLAMAYTADLKDSLDKWIGKASGDQGLISTHKAIIAEQNRHPAKSSAWARAARRGRTSSGIKRSTFGHPHVSLHASRDA